MAANITQLKPEKLHKFWPFIERGLNEIRHKADQVRWLNPDVYAALQYKTASCYLVSRNNKLLGYFIVHPRQIEFTDQTELFLWIGYAIKPRERGAHDDIPGAILDALKFVDRLATEGRHLRVTTLSAREGLLRAEPYKSHFRTQFRSLTLSAISRP